MNNNTNNIDIELLNIEEIAKKIMVSKTTIHRWIKEDGFPSIKIKGTLRFDLHEVMKWVNRFNRNIEGN